jgi:hypothetical protein
MIFSKEISKMEFNCRWLNFWGFWKMCREKIQRIYLNKAKSTWSKTGEYLGVSTTMLKIYNYSLNRPLNQPLKIDGGYEEACR